MRKKIFCLIITVAMMISMIPSLAFAGNAQQGENTTVNVAIDSISDTQKLSFGGNVLLKDKNNAFNLVIGMYNGAKQTVHAVSNVDLEYSWNGKNWTKDEPTFTNATVGLSTILDIVDIRLDSAKNNEKYRKDLKKYLANHSYMMRLKKEPDKICYVMPVILPRELVVDFKNPHMGFIPKTTVKTTDILSARTLSGYENLLAKYSEVVDLVKDIEDPELENILGIIEPALELIATKTTDVCSEDKAIANEFIKKYFKLSNVPEFGTSRSLSLTTNVKFDYNAVQRDLESCNMSLSMRKFLNNYDILPCLVTTFELSGVNAMLVRMKDIDISMGRTYQTVPGDGGIPKTNVGDFVISANYKNFSFNITAIANHLINSKALISYSSNYAKISAKDMSKTYHVGKSKTLKKNKSFKYSASTDYGYLTFTKMSGNKRISIDKYSGKVTVKKGLKRGKTYKLKVLVKAAGKSTTKTVKIKIAK